MQIYAGGQIQEARRGKGDLAVVINQGTSQEQPFDALIYRVTDSEFIYLTGRGNSKHPVSRVYIGVNHDSSGIIVEEAHKAKTAADLRGIDKLILYTHFLPSVGEDD